MYSLPIDKAVEVVDEKGKKANDDGKITDIGKGSKDPQNDEYDVVSGVGKRVIGTAAEGEINRKEAGCHRKRGRKKICRVKGF